MTEKDKNAGLSEPARSLLPSFHAEVDSGGGGLCAVIDGILGISALSHEEACLLTSAERIVISGKDLKISVLENRRIKLSGKIQEIKFLIKEVKKK